MDLGMPFAHKEAWVKLKRCVDQYAQITGNEVACVTSYLPLHVDKHGNNTGVLTNQSTSIHGHGALLKLVCDGLDVAKRNNNEGHSHGSFESSEHSNGHEPYRNGHGINGGTNSIAINSPQGNGTHHDQSVARSLSSSYRSLRLDHPLDNGFNRFQAQNWGLEEERESSSQRATKSKKKSRRNSSKTNQENLELDENLMFGEDMVEEESNSDDSDNDSSQLSGNSYDRPPMLFNAPRRRPQQSHGQIAASLPVTISRNWGADNENGMKFRDNQGPHPPLTYIKAKPPPQANAAPAISHTHQRSQDTPNPETMMASMQALARSVTNDSALIFGERPRPRLNTGESKMPINRLR